MQPANDAPPRLWALLNFLAGFLICIVIVTLLLALAQKPVLATMIAAVKDWQTILAGFLAVLAAKLTVDAIGDQIAQTDRHEEDRRQRKNRAARAELPAALSLLTGYANNCLDLIKFIPFDGDERVLLPAETSFAIPSIPQEALATLRRCIETSDDTVYDAMATLLEKIQVQQSRLKNIAHDVIAPSNRIVTRSQLAGAAVDANEIFARINLMWDYARRDSETIRKTLVAADLINNLRFDDFREEDYPGIQDSLEFVARQSEE